MNICVAIKPDMTGREIGPFERLALEAGLRLSASLAAQGIPSTLWVITAGPPSWKDLLYRALGTGADRGIHLCFPPSSKSMDLIPAAAVSTALARAIHGTSVSFDLILTGVMSQDLMAGQTGPMLARCLELPCVTAAVRLEWEGDSGLSVLREMEGGVREHLEVPLPALVSVQSGFYTPRYPVLSHMLKAREKPVLDLPLDHVPETAEIFGATLPPAQTREGRVADGGIEQQVAAFKAFLRERGIV